MKLNDCKYYLGDETESRKKASELLLTLEIMGVLSDKFIQYIYNNLLTVIWYQEKNDLTKVKEIYLNVNKFMESFTLFSTDLRSRVYAPFLYILQNTQDGTT